MIRSPHILGAVATVLAVASPYAGIPEWTPSLATVSTLIAVSLMGLNLIFGYCGMLVLGQAAFSAAAAYTGTMIFNAGAPGPVALFTGFVLVVITAHLLAGLFTRLPGFYLAIGTLGFAYVTEGLARALPITGGASGLVLREQIRLSIDQWYALSVAVLIVALLSMHWFLRGSMSRTLQLVRQDELAAEVAGIDVTRLKTRIFTIGAAYSAAGGLILSQYVGVVSPEMGGPSTSLEYLAMAIIGGAGSLLGPVVGSAAIHWLFAVSGAAHELELLVFGGSFLIVVLFAPRGIVGLIRTGMARVGLVGGDAPVARAAALPPPPQPLDIVVGTPKLVATSVTKRFGGLRAVNAISIDARAGEVLGLLGPNGAGKSTFFNVLSGIESADEGSVMLAGTDITRYSIHRRSRLIGRSFQVPRLIPGMTVLQNVMVRVDQIYPQASEAERVAIALSQLEMFDLGSLAGRPAQEVAIGLHKLIDIARASLGNLPVVLMDEPGVGLSPEELDRLRSIIWKLRSNGTALVIVDHNIDFILSVADRILVMEQGTAIAVGSADEVMKDTRVQQAYLGTFA